MFKASELALWKKYTVSIKFRYNYVKFLQMHRPDIVVIKDILIGAGGLGFDFLAGPIVRGRHHWDVYSELCCHAVDMSSGTRYTHRRNATSTMRIFLLLQKLWIR